MIRESQRLYPQGNFVFLQGSASSHTAKSTIPQSVLPLNWGGTEPNCTVTCMVLKATDNDRRHLALYHDEFCGP
ncbi:hypothetical protein TNCV_4596041 [Trichonephila clavipes]|uniref:Uncharacterized protein n=1 Tax=Trichonephila clavipes TaxID=2585209 RepID=A0A8X6WH75_TRICX|nr:hypothetical protein TNCV_4596041 [Trichonephila clavipes]